jgi:hypothetical protein
MFLAEAASLTGKESGELSEVSLEVAVSPPQAARRTETTVPKEAQTKEVRMALRTASSEPRIARAFGRDGARDGAKLGRTGPSDPEPPAA